MVPERRRRDGWIFGLIDCLLVIDLTRISSIVLNVIVLVISSAVEKSVLP